jgi:hypothetical protein
LEIHSVADAPPPTPFAAFAAATGFDQDTAERAFFVLWSAGFTVMPLEPSKEMLLAAQAEHENCIDRDWDSGPGGQGRNEYVTIAPDAPARLYRAMLDELYQNDEEQADV